jgi:hypothetical protein
MDDNKQPELSTSREYGTIKSKKHSNIEEQQEKQSLEMN